MFPYVCILSFTTLSISTYIILKKCTKKKTKSSITDLRNTCKKRKRDCEPH